MLPDQERKILVLAAIRSEPSVTALNVTINILHYLISFVFGQVREALCAARVLLTSL